VTCVSASECWSVGHFVNGSGSFQSLIERWDGVAWTIVNSPNTSSTQFNLLNGVNCVSASECWAVGYSSDGNTYQTLTQHYIASPSPIPVSVVSRMSHGGAGTFDVDLALPASGIECRSGAASEEYQIVVTFLNSVTYNSAAVTSGTGVVSSSSGNGTTAITLNLSGVTNAQTIAITLTSVNDGSNTGDIAISMSVLNGDTNADGFVNSGDIAQTKSQSGIAVTSSNFREDTNADGSINSGDIGLTKSKSGTALP
jgi:hypothetical protein